jgi:hypothetical protein
MASLVMAMTIFLMLRKVVLSWEASRVTIAGYERVVVRHLCRVLRWSDRLIRPCRRSDDSYTDSGCIHGA